MKIKSPKLALMEEEIPRLFNVDCNAQQEEDLLKFYIFCSKKTKKKDKLVLAYP